MTSQTTLIWAGATGAAVAAVAAAAIVLTHSFAPNPAPAFVAAPAANGPARSAPEATIAAAPPEAAAAAATKPAFDVVSVEPGGETVVAGRAAPNVRVALLDGARTLGEATADARGQFVIIPDPLAPGDHSLVLATGSAPAERSNPAPVSVAAPPPPAAAGPAPRSPPPAPPAGSPALAIRSVEADAQGRLAAIGAAAPNATVRLYVSGGFVGDAKAAGDGHWSLTIERGMLPGPYVCLLYTSPSPRD